MKRILTFMIFMGLSVLVSFGQYRQSDVYSGLYDSDAVTAMKSHVRELSAAVMEGRKAGSEGEKAAAAYVRDKFKEYGIDMLSPKEGDVFGIKTDSGDTLTSRNVIGFVEGYDKNLRNKYIVVGARLDNLGTMTMTIDGVPVEKIYYGANGNASGLAMLIELARMVQTNSILFRRSVIFVAFGASTKGFAGSWYFLDRSFSDAASIDAMINLDMVGTGYKGFYAYTSSNSDMNALLKMQTEELQPILPEIVADEPYPSDHRVFYSKEIPSVMFTTGRYTEHNSDKDTQGIIDFETMEREMEYVFNFTLALANTERTLSFRPSQVSVDPGNEDAVSFYDCDTRPTFSNNSDPRYFLKEWVYRYLRYPRSAVKDGIQGTVMVQFIIEKDGKITDVKVVKSVDEELDAEAIRVIEASPKWKPGKMGGNRVRTSLTLPVEFRLEKKSDRPSFGIKGINGKRK